jgi:hypothetical protein
LHILLNISSSKAIKITHVKKGIITKRSPATQEKTLKETQKTTAKKNPGKPLKQALENLLQKL